MQGYKHDIVIVNEEEVSNDKIVESGKKMVSIANDGDPYYSCEFETRQEVDKFISELIEAKNKAFGEKDTKCT